MEGRWVDLHTHTSASDGDLSPADLVDAAKATGLAAIAITDHDTIGGVPEALERGGDLGLQVISGVEISVQVEKGRTCHLLGYDLDMGHTGLRRTLKRLQRARSERNERLLERLEALGKPLDPALIRCAGGRQLGRPHFALAMVQQGYVESSEEAFRRYLGKGSPAYVDKFRLGPRDAIALIGQAGGVPVLAHPYTLGFQTPLELEAFVKALVEDAGLMGIEVLYPEHEPHMITHYKYLADKYGLVMTGGTDYHGSAKADMLLGWGRGSLRVPFEWVERLRRHARNARSFCS